MIAFTLVAIGSFVYAITAYAGYRAVRDMAAHAAARHDAMETLLLVERTMALLLEMESGQRGFMLSGRDEFLEPFTKARQTLRSVHPQLSRQLSRSPMEQARDLQPVIDDMIQQRTVAADSTIASRRRWGPDANREMSEHLYSKTLMDRLRKCFATLETLQAEEVHRRSQDSEQLSALSSTVVALLTAGGTLLMVGALWTLRHERTQRDRADRRVARANARLEQQVMQRTSALSEAMQQVQSFTAQLDLRIEEERKRLSREVHDQLGQIATAAKMVAKDIARSNPDLPPAPIEQLTGLLDEAIGTSRRIAAELRPPMLDDLGLSAAIDHHLAAISAFGNLQTSSDVADDHVLSAAQSNQLFRILQEASTNVLRHAQAKHLDVRGAANGLQYTFEVTDDGRGPQHIRPDASGIRNMKERAALAGGSLQFGPRPEGGTCVLVNLPVQEGTPCDS